MADSRPSERELREGQRRLDWPFSPNEFVTALEIVEYRARSGEGGSS